MGKQLEELELELKTSKDDLKKVLTQNMLINDKLKACEDKLKASNKDLKDFAYAASHDLQAPVRHIKWISDKIRESLENNEEINLDLLIKLESKCENITSLIQDLLEYSRINTRGVKFSPCPCEEPLKEAINNLQINNNSNIKIDYSDLPTLKIDKGQITRVFQNLFENSINFKGVNDPSIMVSAELKNNEWVFKVSDNGKGIKIEDKEDHDRAFLIFKKLYVSDDGENEMEEKAEIGDKGGEKKEEE